MLTTKINTVKKNIALLSASQFISDIGTASYISFVNLWLIQIFKDSAVIGTIVSITEITMFFLSPLISTLIKGKNIKLTIVASDYLRAAVMVLLFLLIHYVNITIIISIFILLSTLNCVFDGAAIVIIKRIGEKSNLVKLNTFLVLLANASLLIGQYLGGYCFTKKGISEILIINAVSFLISGLINQFLHRQYCTAVDKMQGSVFKDLYTAIKAVIKNKTAIILIITILLINIHSAVSGFSVFFLFSGINNSIFTPDAYTGFIMAGTVGNIIGLSITVTTGDNIFKIKHIPLLLIFIFLCTIFHFSFGNIIYVCIINCLIFIALGLMNFLLEAYIMHTIDENFLGQYYTVSANIKLLLSPAITYALGCLLRTVSAVYVYTGSAALLIGPILYIVFNVKKLKI